MPGSGCSICISRDGDLDVHLDLAGFCEHAEELESIVASLAAHAKRLKSFAALSDGPFQEPFRLFCDALVDIIAAWKGTDT
jgi:hypothetical protein